MNQRKKRHPQRTNESKTSIPPSAPTTARDRIRALFPSAAASKVESTDALRSLGDFCLKAQVTKDEWVRRTESIKDQIMRKSRHVVMPNFRTIHTNDIVHAAELYDDSFFDRLCLSNARKFGLRFRLSARMTSAGGKTTRVVWPATLTRKAKTEYEIAISTSLLFQTFQDGGEPVNVCGVNCATRLDAMLRIMEHELIHLAEMLAWHDSDCSASRFQGIAYRMFYHTEHRHQLTTQHERARALFNIRVGSHVEFCVAGKMHRGLVNRITRRATVLVESSDGVLFSDGKRYTKYYVPLPQLRIANLST